MQALCLKNCPGSSREREEDQHARRLLWPIDMTGSCFFPLLFDHGLHPLFTISAIKVLFYSLVFAVLSIDAANIG
jgi:hypothetical protein